MLEKIDLSKTLDKKEYKKRMDELEPKLALLKALVVREKEYRLIS